MEKHKSFPITEQILTRARELVLSSDEKSRYSRHLLLPEVGVTGQQALKSARVLIVGAGGLGSPAAFYLAAAGVGHIGVVDFDVVEASNLQRQILFCEKDTGDAKSRVAADRLKQLNSFITVEAIAERLDKENISEIFSRFDIILDGTDNFPTRYLVNDAAVFLKKPVVHGSIFRFDGQMSVFYAGHGPCYRCLFPSPPPLGHVPNCAEGGVLGVLPGVVGTIQATEVLKLITGSGESLVGRLLTYDALAMKFSEFKFTRDSECSVCGEHPTIKTLEESSDSCALSAVLKARKVNEINVSEYLEICRLERDFILLDVRTAQEQTICRIPGSVSMPLAELSARISELPKEKQIVIHCKSGQRSLMAAEVLLASGFERVSSLTGGIISWQQATNSDQATY